MEYTISTYVMYNTVHSVIILVKLRETDWIYLGVLLELFFITLLILFLIFSNSLLAVYSVHVL